MIVKGPARKFFLAGLVKPRWLIPLVSTLCFVGFQAYLAMVQRRRRIVILLSISVVIALALAVRQLWLDAPHMGPKEHYCFVTWKS